MLMGTLGSPLRRWCAAQPKTRGFWSEADAADHGARMAKITQAS